MITEKELTEQIEKVEELMKIQITLLNYDFYETLFHIHSHLWSLRYFKLHQEKTFLDEAKDDN